jgi:hypothetical protein
MSLPPLGSLPTPMAVDSPAQASTQTANTAEAKQPYSQRPADGRRMAVADLRDPTNQGTVGKTEKVAQAAKPQ